MYLCTLLKWSGIESILKIVWDTEKLRGNVSSCFSAQRDSLVWHFGIDFSEYASHNLSLQSCECPGEGADGPQSPVKNGICSINIHPVPPERRSRERPLGFQGTVRSRTVHSLFMVPLPASSPSPGISLSSLTKSTILLLLLFFNLHIPKSLNNCKPRIWVSKRLKEENTHGKWAVFPICPATELFLPRCLGVIPCRGRTQPYIHCVYPYISRISIPKSWSNTLLFPVIAAMLQILPLNGPRVDGGSLVEVLFGRGRRDLNRHEKQRGGNWDWGVCLEIAGNGKQGPKGSGSCHAQGCLRPLLQLGFVRKMRAQEFNKNFIAFGAAVRSLNFDERSCYSDVSMVLGVDSGSNRQDFS